jgi:membrane-associated protease RseP (regulator of RpoE activity)
VLLFVLTTLSVLFVHIASWTPGGFSDPQSWKNGLIFASCLMGILLAHELGHYLVARAHGFEQSLPIFLPIPVGFGTMGAIIRLKSPPRSRTALLEMGAAGPIAGAVVAFAILVISLPWTDETVDMPPGTVGTVFNDPLIVKLLGLAINGHVPGRFATYHPATLAAWVGCFLTGLNLLPTGQLDGGHVLNGAAPKFAHWLARLVPLALIGAGIIALTVSLWSGMLVPAAMQWLVWGGLIRFAGADCPIPVPLTPLTPRARILAALIAVLFILTFMPVPMEIDIVP